MRSAALRAVVVLPGTRTVRATITSAFERHVDVLAGDAKVVPHSLYLARDVASGTQWAVADFEPTEEAFQEGRSMGPPFDHDVLPGRPDPVVAIAGGAVTLTRAKGSAWRVFAQGGVDWPCQDALPSAVWSAWHLGQSVLCRAEQAVPLATPLPHGSYFGYITAVHVRHSGLGTIIFDPETVAPNGAVTDRYPYTYRLDVGAYTTFEQSSGFNAAAANTSDQPWGSAIAQELASTNTPGTPTAAPWPYAVEVAGGRATFVKQFSNVTPTCWPLGGDNVPTSPTDRSQGSVQAAEISCLVAAAVPAAPWALTRRRPLCARRDPWPS